MCSEPVTLGGGSTMLNTGLPESGSAVNAPMDSQKEYQRASTSLWSKAFGRSDMDWHSRDGHRAADVPRA